MRARLTVLTACLLVAGCGGSGTKTKTVTGPPVLGRPAPKAAATQAAQDLGFPGFATKNTTRVGGADPIADAAGVALAVFPAAAADARPQAVSIVDAGDWRSAISAAQLLARPVVAPILFSQGGDLPPASADALKILKPTGATKLGGAKVVRVGDAAATPSGLKAKVAGGKGYATVARSIDGLQAEATGSHTREVLVAPSGEPAFAMPAAGPSAPSGAPVLWASKNAVPKATERAIKARKNPRIYVIGPSSAISSKVATQLGKLG